MLDLNIVAKEIIENRIRRGWPSARDLSKTSLGLLEESGEFEKARRMGNREMMKDSLIDTMIFCLGGLNILRSDAEKMLQEVIMKNKTRKHNGHH